MPDSSRRPERLQSPPDAKPERDPEQIAEAPYGLVTTACQYCVVGCGYEAHLWNTGNGSDASPQLEQAHWVSPAMTADVQFGGTKRSAAVVPDPKCSMNKGNHSPRGGTQGRNLVYSERESATELDTTKERIATAYVRTRNGLEPIGVDDAVDILAALVKVATGWRKRRGRVSFQTPGGLGVKLYEYQYLENTFAATRLFYQLIGTPNVAYHDRPSVASNTQGFNDSGIDPHGYAYDDIWESDVLLLAGNNPYECHSVFFMQYMAGKKIVVLDPRRTVTADYAEKTGGLHLQPRVLGADTYVLNALAWYIRLRQQADPDDWPSRLPSELIAGEQQLSDASTQASKSLAAEGPAKRRKALNQMSERRYFEFLSEQFGGESDPDQILQIAEEVSGIPANRLAQAAQLLAGPSTDVASDLPAPAQRNVSLIFEKGLIWGYGYQNTAAMANLGLLLGSVLRPGEEGVSTLGVTGRAGGHQKGWAEARYQVSTRDGQQLRRWSAGYPFHNATDEFTSGDGTSIRTYNYLDAHLVGNDAATRHPDSRGPADPDINLLWTIGTNFVGQIGNANQKVEQIDIRRGINADSALPASKNKRTVLRSLKRRIKNGQLVVVQQDIYPNPSTEHADLILPAAGWGEEDFTRYTGERRLRLYGKFQDPPSWRDPATGQLETDADGKPVSRCLPDWVIFQRVAQRLLPDDTVGNGLPDGFSGYDLSADDFGWHNTAELFRNMARHSNRAGMLGALEAGPGNSPRGHALLRARGTEGYILPVTVHQQRPSELRQHWRTPVPQPTADKRPYAFVRSDWSEIREHFQANSIREGEFYLCNGRVNELWNSMFTNIRNETVRQRWPDDMPGTILELHPDHARELSEAHGIPVTNGTVVTVHCDDIHLGAQRGEFRAVVILQEMFTHDDADRPRCAFVVFSYPAMSGTLESFPFRQFNNHGYVNNVTTGYVDPLNPIAAVKYARGRIVPTEERYEAGQTRLGPSTAQRSIALPEQRVPADATREQRLDWQMRELTVQKGLPRHKLGRHAAYRSLFRRPDELLAQLQAGLDAVFARFLSTMNWRVDGELRDTWNDPYLSFARSWAGSAEAESMLDLLRDKQERAAQAPTHATIEVNCGPTLADLFRCDDRLDEVLAFLREGSYGGKKLIVAQNPEESEFFRLISESGPMGFAFSPEDREIVREWILSLPEPGADPEANMMALLAARRQEAAGEWFHSEVPIDAQTTLRDLFQRGDLTGVRNFLLSGSWQDRRLIVPGKPQASKFYQLIDSGAMAGVFSATERKVVEDWILSLEEDTQPPVMEPRQAMLDVLRSNQGIAQIMHSAVAVSDGNGGPAQTLSDLFDREEFEQILGFLERAPATKPPFVGMPLVQPGQPDQSAFYLHLTDPSGVMFGRLTDPEVEIVRRWVESLPPESEPSEPAPGHLLAEPVATGLNRPLFATAPPGDTQWLFILEQSGTIRRLNLQSGELDAQPFFEVPNIQSGGERGLLGLAFHPDFAQNGLFYINCTDQSGNTNIRRYKVVADGQTADPASEQIVLSIPQPFANHNGGFLAFGPRDGFLYIATGDGGSGNDPQNRAQNLNSLLGKMLRIDVAGDDFPDDPARNYSIPTNNPFVDRVGVRPEIWAYGLRNPWRCSFDRATGDLYIGDVGQNAIEEIDFQPAGSAGGENYGWRIKEGLRPTGLDPIGSQPLVDPIHQYTHDDGHSVIGGYVYRGSAAAMQGEYLFADLSGRVWSLTQTDGTAHNVTERTDEIKQDGEPIRAIASFGEDAAGELYLCSLQGSVYRLQPQPGPAGDATRLQYRVHPAVGIARVGDSPEYYLGPETLEEVANAGQPYRDDNGFIKKQAQRFRIYEYALDGDVAKPVREIAGPEAQITWHVHLANRKAALRQAFSPAQPRNVGEDPNRLIIDAQRQDLPDGDTAEKTLAGKFRDIDVELGRILLDEEGRLIVMGGDGKADGPAPARDLHFANNDDWYDDTSDGIISATIEIDGQIVEVSHPARLLVGPPGYAPGILNIVTLYDVALQAAREQDPSVWPSSRLPSFYEDILPILRRTVMLQWVSELAELGHGEGRGGQFLQSSQLALLADNNQDVSSSAYQRRREVFARLRVPNESNPPTIFPGDPPMPASRRTMPVLRASMTLTPLQYEQMRKWSLGHFSNDLPSAAQPFADLPVPVQVAILDRAALEQGTGGPFFPGIESWSVMGDKETYSEPFRVKSTLPPGHLTIGNALPWQADFNACGTGWWPAQRPNSVSRMENGQLQQGVDWADFSNFEMVAAWLKLGFVVERADGKYLETERLA